MCQISSLQCYRVTLRDTNLSWTWFPLFGLIKFLVFSRFFFHFFQYFFNVLFLKLKTSFLANSTVHLNTTKNNK